MNRLSLALLVGGVMFVLLALTTEASHNAYPLGSGTNSAIAKLGDNSCPGHRATIEAAVNTWNRSEVVNIQLVPGTATLNCEHPSIYDGATCYPSPPECTCDPPGGTYPNFPCAWSGGRECIDYSGQSIVQLCPQLEYGLAGYGCCPGKIRFNSDSFPQSPYVVLFWQGIMCHEMGHWLGVNHFASTPQTSCMNSPAYSSTPIVPEQHDFDTIAAIYTLPGCNPCLNMNGDFDGDGVLTRDESFCGANAYDSLRKPERLNGIDDDFDNLIDEALPTNAVPSSVNLRDCDGDTWSGNAEKYIFSSANFTHNQKPCMPNGWPPDPQPQNGNGRVQVDDVVFASSAFGSTTTPRAEIASQNGIVQVDDVVMFSALFGATC